ncbi:hypothetical protein P3S68_000563 [Capsicum galapagoense]
MTQQNNICVGLTIRPCGFELTSPNPSLPAGETRPECTCNCGPKFHLKAQISSSIKLTQAFFHRRRKLLLHFHLNLRQLFRRLIGDRFSITDLKALQSSCS